MKKEYFQLELNKRKKIQDQIKALLQSHKEIVFAYLYGSFVAAPSFRDIDIAVFIDPLNPAIRKRLDYERNLGAEVRLPYPIDIRLLNSAPLGFQNNVAHSGILLFVRDKKQLADFLERSSRFMLQNAGVIRESLAALVS